MNNEIKSPITGTKNVSLIKVWPVDKLVKAYEKEHNYDVNRLFKDIKEIYQYKCEDTGYVFFNPVVEGDSEFYAYYQKFDWYYNPWKWEHQQIIPFLKDNSTVLEIGSGRGDFISKINSEYNANAIGLELNK